MSVQPEHLRPVAVKGGLRVGVIGLGMIGGGVVASLDRRGLIATVYDVDPKAADRLDVETSVASSPAEVARVSDVVLVAVVDTEQVRAVLHGADGVLEAAEPGLVVVVLSTLPVADVVELAEECAAHSVSLVDCGVTPGDQAGANGMVAMVGGDERTVRRVMPVLADFAKQVVHCGPLGAGMATKIARNVVTYGSWRVMHEASEIAKSAGVQPETLMSVIEAADPSGTTMSSLLRNRSEQPEMMAEHAGSMLRLMDKDLGAAQDLAHEQDLDVPLVDTVRAYGSDTLRIDDEAVVDDAPPAEGDNRGALGLETMATVYGPGLAGRIPAENRTPTLQMTIEHLFGEVWSRPGLSIRDRRLLVLGATAALGRADLIEVQVRGALLNDELTAEELQEAVLQLHYYVGWGNGTRVQEGVDAALASVRRSA